MGEKRRILYASSSRSPWFEKDCEAHWQAAPYSIDAIGYHLEKRGWKVDWAGFRTTISPFRLAKKIDVVRPDIVYTYGSLTALMPLFCRKRLCQWKHFKIVHGWDDAYGDDIWADLLGWPGRVYMNWIERRIVTESDAVVTLSYFLRQRGLQWGVNCHYIPNGADPIDRTTVKVEKPLEGRFKLVYTGSQARWKRTEAICEAMRHVPADIKLYLTGHPNRQLQQRYASNNCIFLGYLSKAEQRAVMSQADVFVCTADQDCNAKIQEYLRWERPYLGYDGRANLFFKNGQNALLTKDYPSAILRLASDAALRERLVNYAKTDIVLYSWDEIAAQFASYFEALLS